MTVALPDHEAASATGEAGMALFFDAEWFDGRLAAIGMNRDVVAAALGLDRGAVDEIFKDQRELQPAEVQTLANLLQADIAEIVSRAGVATPTPASAEGAMPAELGARLNEMNGRLARIEETLMELKAMIEENRHA